MAMIRDIEDRAAEWLAREDRGIAEDDRRELEAWLGESTAHRVAYLRLKGAWGRAGRLAALRGPAMAIPAETVTAIDPVTKRRKPMNFRAAAAVGAAAIGLSLLVATWQRVPEDQYQTHLGGREVVPLADGSRLELNTDTRIRARVTSDSRTVWLERGEAYFEVARDESRPFVVIAGDRRVTVLGTKFSVRREADDVQVRVLEGKVRVDKDPPALAIRSERPLAMLVGGQVALARNDSTLVAQRTTQEVANELAWREGMLVMNQWTLAEAAREFNRYNRKKLVVEPSAADIRLGGTFELGNVEAFSRLLKDGFGLQVSAEEDRIRVSN